MPVDEEYERDRLEAAADIQENGKRAYLLVRARVGGTERAPIWDEVAHPLWVVEINQRLRNLDGSLAPATVHSVLIANEATTHPVSRSDRIAFSTEPGAASYPIVDLRPLRPGNVIILWEADLGG